MKAEDFNSFKSTVKSAVQRWAENKIDELFPKKAATKSFFKNGLNNLLAREDSRINKWLDTLFLFLSDESGVIDSDHMVDMASKLFQEMDAKEFNAGLLHAIIGKGEITIEFPRNFLFEALAGNTGSVKFTSADILELKKFITN